MALSPSSPKLGLNKTTLQRLSAHEMSNVQGGFTYSLSTGEVCQDSNARWHNVLAENGTVAPVITGTGPNTEPSAMHKPRNADQCATLPQAPPQ